MKPVLYIFSGILIHMLYIDSIFIYETKVADKCFVKYEKNEVKSRKCLERLNSASHRYKGKYFNLVSALSYQKISLMWSME